MSLIQYIIDVKNPEDYLDFCKDFFNKIILETEKPITTGINKGKNQTFYLFKEESTSDNKYCNEYGGLDQYGLCSFIYDFNDQIELKNFTDAVKIMDNYKPIIKTRFASFPWK
jgi:hypothetical protein